MSALKIMARIFLGNASVVALSHLMLTTIYGNNGFLGYMALLSSLYYFTTFGIFYLSKRIVSRSPFSSLVGMTFVFTLLRMLISIGCPYIFQMHNAMYSLEELIGITLIIYLYYLVADTYYYQSIMK